MVKDKVRSDIVIQAIEEEISIRDLVTMVMYSKECFIAMYRSTFNKTR